MKLTTIVLAITIMTGAAWAQNPGDIDTVRSIAKSLQQQQTVKSNAALQAAGTPVPKASPVVSPMAKPAAAVVPAKVAQSAQPIHVVAMPAKAGAATASPTSAPVKNAAAPAKHTPVVPRHAAKPLVAKAHGPKTVIHPVAVKRVMAKPTSVKPEPAKAEAAPAPKPEDKKWAMTGKRDPFFSPVVQQAGGSGCSTGKKCLEIGQINVRGVVKSDSGFIAVVTNNLNKAYFLHENDPVFNGYVVKITDDSVVFQETLQDKLGKSFTREVVKRITTPAV